MQCVEGQHIHLHGTHLLGTPGRLAFWTLHDTRTFDHFFDFAISPRWVTSSFSSQGCAASWCAHLGRPNNALPACISSIGHDGRSFRRNDDKSALHRAFDLICLKRQSRHFEHPTVLTKPYAVELHGSRHHPAGDTLSTIYTLLHDILLS